MSRPGRVGWAAGVAVCLLAASAAEGASFFLSSSDTDPFAGMDLFRSPGESGSYFVWVTPTDETEALIGMALDVTADDSTVTEATSVTVFNPELAFGEFIIGPRWNGVNGGSLGDHVTNIVAVGITTQGISAPLAAYDPLATGDSFLYAEVEFIAHEVGFTNLTVSEGSSQIVSRDNAGDIPMEFAGGTITVGIVTHHFAVSNPDPGDLSSLLQTGYESRDGGRFALPIEVSSSGDDAGLVVFGSFFDRTDEWTDVAFDLVRTGDRAFELVARGPFNHLPPGTQLSADFSIQTNQGELIYSASLIVPEPATLTLAALGCVALAGLSKGSKTRGCKGQS